MVRVGNNKDGGYIVSENGIKSCEFLLTIGLGYNFSFEKDFLKLKKSDSLLIKSYDNSVSKKIMRKYLMISLKSIPKIGTLNVTGIVIEKKVKNL